MVRKIVFAALAASLPVVCAAVAQTRWHCTYAPSRGEYVLCQLLEAPAEGPLPLPPGASRARLPRLASDIRHAPQTLDDVPIAIPVHGPPIDMADTERLARNVMCGPSTDCEVHFHAERQGLVRADRIGVRPPRR